MILVVGPFSYQLHEEREVSSCFESHVEEIWTLILIIFICIFHVVFETRFRKVSTLIGITVVQL